MLWPHQSPKLNFNVIDQIENHNYVCIGLNLTQILYEITKAIEPVNLF